MADEIRTEEFVETEVVETEDVNENEGLTATDYAVIGGIMAAGALVFEGGKWVWKKTAGPRGKVADFCRDKFGKKAKKDAEGSQDQDHEGSAKKSSKKTKEKKTETKEKSEEK